MVTNKELNEFAVGHGYHDLVEYKTYEDHEIVKEARKMIERGY